MLQIIGIILLIGLAVWLVQTFWPALLVLLAIVIAVVVYQHKKYLKTSASEHWTKWEHTFSSKEQRKRYQRAIDGELTLKTVSLEKMSATFLGHDSKKIYITKLTNCTCPDFQRRKVPCKHMYKLAHELGLEEMHYNK